jgi:N utilization substance protein A
MAALVVPGAPVAVLLDHGMAEGVVDKLAEAGILTVEKLGAMTPEQLEEIPGIGPELVENIQQAVVGYYGQFEETPTPPAASAAGSDTPGENVATAESESPREIESTQEIASTGEIASNGPVMEVAAAAVAEDGMPETVVLAEASEEQSVTIDNKERVP